ncbi:hypothetical protein [Deinococcus hohokamensis]|uniref:Uncharacterized protein n=1 Tax=Deinococcus hohokamensis TaxID=309883 RepID=A0ABV9IBT8_9DEIO
MAIETGTALALATILSSVAIPAWAHFSKGRDSTVAHLVGERDRLDKRVAELEAGRKEDQARFERMENDLAALRLDHKTLLDFLRDIVSGRFDGEWVKGRAADLLARFGGGGTS